MYFHLCIIKDVKYKETNKGSTHKVTLHWQQDVDNTRTFSRMQFSVAHHNQSLNRINIWASEVLKDYGVEEQARRRSHPGKHFVETVRLSKLFKLRRQDCHCEYILLIATEFQCSWTSHRYDSSSMILRHLSIAFFPYHSLPSNDN